jgi:hypothetical protein
MPKIPTFTATGSVERLAGTTSNIKINPNANIFNAFKPVTDFVVNQKIKENTLQNQAEALKLENDFITDMQSVTQTIKTDSKYATNKDAANIYLKEKSDAFIEKYRALATNGDVQDKFHNYALAEVQKSIFKVDTLISKQIITSLNNSYGIAKKNLLLTAYMDGGLAKETLATDLIKLTIDTYSSQVSPPDLQKLLDNIPVEIDLFDGLEDLSNSPKKTFQLLKNKNYLPNLSRDQRIELEEKAKTYLRPQIEKEFTNYMTYIEDGKEPPVFDFELAKEVMTEPVFENMMVTKTVIEDSVDDVKFLHTLPNQDLDSTVTGMIEEVYKTYPIDIAKQKEIFLAKVLENIKSNREADPIKYLFKVDDDIKNMSIEIDNMTASFSAPNIYDTSAMAQAKLEFAETLIQKQKDLNIKNIKLMTNDAALSFVAAYTEAGNKNDIPTMNDMMQTLNLNYGDNDGLALRQLLEAGLPYGAKVSYIFGDGELAQEGLSFDTQAEKDASKQFLKDNNVKISDIQIEIRENLKDFESILRRNVPLNSSGTLTEMDNLVEYLSFVAANRMYGKEMDASEAAISAAQTFNDNFHLEDTFYLPKKIDGENVGDGQINKIVETADILQKYYLDEFGAVAFKSSRETDAVKLSSKMYSQMLLNGEWRNMPDGENLIFGIVLDGSNEFAPIENANGENLILNINDTSELVPGTNIPIDFTLNFSELSETSIESMISVYEKASEIAKSEGITYEEALKKVKKPNIKGITFNDGKKNSEIPVDDQSSIFKTIGDAIITPAYGSEMNLTSSKRIILDKVGGDIYNEKSQNNLQKFIAAVYDVESNSGDKDFLLNESSATGFFQFKTKDNLDKNGEVKLDKNGTPLKSSFETALSRLETQYKKANTTIPNWVKKAKETKNPTKFILEELTYNQQEELFLMNIYGQTNSDTLIKAMLNGDMEKAMELYARFHHTKLNVVNDKEIKRKFKKAYK